MSVWNRKGLIMKSVDIKGKPYIEVNERIKYFRENYKNWSLTSEIISLENGVCVIKATVKDENEIVKATGFAYEKEGSTFINKTSYIENCETSAWGRALGNLGIGIDTSIASAEEVKNAMLNQNDKPKSKGATPDDAEVYIALSKINDIEVVKSYYETNKLNVNDRKAFHDMATKRIEALKEIADKFDEVVA